MVRPERRTKADLAVVALIVVVVVTGGAAVWVHSDARATVSDPARPVPEPPPATSVPTSMAEVWRAPSSATPVPVVAGPSVVTGAGGEVVGRDATSGQARWRYTRDIPLCTVGAAWDRALAVHRKSRNCSEVTALEGSTGERGPQRTSDAEPGTRLIDDGTYVTTSGDMVETWRSDLVRTQQYGVPLDLRNPDNNLKRPECRRTSVAVGDKRVAVIERCPADTVDRLTVLEAKPEDHEEPEEVFSTGLAEANATVVAVNGANAAVAFPGEGKLAIYGSDGILRDEFELPKTSLGEDVVPTAPEQLRTVRLDPAQAPDLPRVARSLADSLREIDPAISLQSVLAAASRDGRVATVPEAELSRVDEKIDGLPGVSFGGAVYWHTGTATVALDATTLAPLWTAPGTLGPGSLFGGELLLPVPSGLAVHDPSTGAPQRIIPVDRQGYTGKVELDTVGDVLLEQRGDTLVALR